MVPRGKIRLQPLLKMTEDLLACFDQGAGTFSLLELEGKGGEVHVAPR